VSALSAFMRFAQTIAQTFQPPLTPLTVAAWSAARKIAPDSQRVLRDIEQPLTVRSVPYFPCVPDGYSGGVQASQGIIRVRRQRVVAEGRDLLVALDGPRPVAELFVRLAELVERIRAAARALAKSSEAFDRQIGLTKI